MTEASHQMASNPLPPAPHYAGSVGIATGTEIGIAAKDGALLPEGEAGEVVIRGPGVMSGYVANPRATAEAFFGDWFRTGDRGVLRDGYLYLEGRLKEMILRGGENISPAEIEQVLLDHPAVRDAVCFGVPDDEIRGTSWRCGDSVGSGGRRGADRPLPGTPGCLQGSREYPGA